MLFKNYVLDGILLTLLGLALIVWPNDALKTICIIIGISIGILGLLRCISYFTEPDDERNSRDLVTAIIQFAICLSFIVFWEHIIVAFQYLLGIVLLYGAILLFIRAYSIRSQSSIIMKISLVFAVVITVFAIVIFINPEAFASFMMQLYGVSLIVEGIAMLISLHKFKLQYIDETKDN